MDTNVSFFCIWKILGKIYKQASIYLFSKKMKKFFIVISIFLLALVTYFLFTKKDNQPQVQIANPASVNCIDKWWKLSIITNEDWSQYGVCEFEDGSFCEERSLMSKKCKQGDSLKEKEDAAIINLSWVEITYPVDWKVNGNYLSDVSTWISIFATVQELSEIQEPWFNTEDALLEKEALSNGLFWEDNSQSLFLSHKVTKIWDLYTKEYITFSQFEVCSVMFVRTMVFYKDNKRFVVSISAPASVIVDQMSEFFTIDEVNCWLNKTREFDKQDLFYTMLTTWNWTWLAQEWFNGEISIQI